MRMDGILERRNKGGVTDSDKTSDADSIPDDCIRIGNKLYNARKIEAWHPGGKFFIQGKWLVFFIVDFRLFKDIFIMLISDWFT